MAEGEDFDVIDPFPDVYALFLHYNRLYFEDQLGACSVEWSSSRMTLCAGICQYERGGGCRIKLSEPLLKFRPSLELKETLLHEMIHAWMFLCKIRDQGDHGPRFQAKMHFINEAVCSDQERPIQGYNITVYHSMHAEVDQYRTHHWQCPKCQNLVKRAMNRPPQEADCRGRQGKGPDCKDNKCAYHMHERFCGGYYVKIAEPKDYGKKNKVKSAFADGTAVPPKRARVSNTAEPDAPRNSRQHRSITDFFNSISPNSKTEGLTSTVSSHDNTELVGDSPSGTPHGPLPVSYGFSSTDTAGEQTACDVDSSAPNDAKSKAETHTPDGESDARKARPSPATLRQVLARAAMQRAEKPTAMASDTSSQSWLLGASNANEQAEHRSSESTKSEPTFVSEPPDVAHVSAVIDLVDSPSQPDPHPAATSGQPQATEENQCCPVCGLLWPKDTNPAVMYQHVDDCLQKQLL